jgi:hypothetical protein
MYKVMLSFLDELVRIEVKDEQGRTILRSVTMTAPLLSICSLGTDYAIEAVAPALPHPLSIRVNGEEILISNPADPDRPILFKKEALVAAVAKGIQNGQEKQVVERPDTYYGPAKGRHFRIDGGVWPERYGDASENIAGDTGADGPTGPCEAAPL